MKLYEITSALLWLSDSDEISPDAEAQLDALGIALDEKAVGLCKLIRNLESNASALKAEADKFAKRAAASKAAAERWKEYLKTNLQNCKLERLEAGLFKIRIQANSIASVYVVGDPADLPADYRVETVEADKDALREAWKRGETLPRGVTVERGTHIRIS